MNLTIYKGFDSEFLESLQEQPLLKNSIAQKKDILSFDNITRKNLRKSLFSLEEDESVWATYEEYTLIKSLIDDAIAEDGLILKIFRNNLYPDYYPLDFHLSSDLVTEILQ